MSKKKKQDLYEYQYTTPSKKVVKEMLPAVRKPSKLGDYQGKITWGGILGAVGAWKLLGTLDMLSYAGTFGILKNIIIYGVFLGIGIYQFIKGKNYVNRANRYSRYMKLLEHKQYAAVEELAGAVAKSTKTVVKDLEFMIEQKWFLEGRMDEKKSQFMLTDKVYEQYKLAEQGRVMREQEELEKQKVEQDPVQKEIMQLVTEGNRYVKEIRKLNDEILGEDISNQLDKIEEIIASIFEIIKRKPEKRTELRKLMQYYLPMTVKVVTSYRDFENEKVPSRQLEDSKKEIRDTLDKVIMAFESLREKIFQEEVLDVSTDLDVLEAMMSQEGLIRDEITDFSG
ncbi:MAG: 5-bromo-4-chloroindolyl phosphate hydrolysis family protein [Lachnospiraceae bacterium]|nr:5-bromo-4-chloroindolyl phosphate hydrolysis family protein [Lachnospiraceae bacterium]